MKSVVSLFAGIGGFDLGFTRAGFKVVAHVEKDANCRKLLAVKWPDAVALDDVCTAGAHNLPPCNVVTFGFPCQDLSVAGKRAGLAGGRSGLFYEATRIINEIKPAFCLFENVPGLLSSDGGRDFARVLMEMDRIGYCGAWRVLDAQWLGVAQRRRRVFGLFTRLDSGAERCAEILSLQESLRGHPAPRREAGEGTPRSVAHCLGSGGNLRHREDQDTLVPGTDGACAGHVVPAVAGTLSCNTGPNGHDAGNFASNQGVDAGYLIPAVAGCLQERDAKGADSDTKPGHLVPVAVRTANTQANGHGIAQNVTHTLDQAQGQAVAVPCYGIDEEQNAAENLMGCLKARKEGGGFEAAVAFAQNTRDELREMEVVGALAAEPGMKQTSYLRQSMQVRRLTPTECERLQGFPDGWTAGFSDSTRYKMLGNAVCVNVAEWIAGRMAGKGKEA